MRYSIVLVTAALFFGAAGTSFAIGLTEADFEYLATQNVEKDSILRLNLSPKEQARLHSIINFVSTPTTKAKDVTDALEAYTEHQRWELAHPGELWDVQRR
jgi:hypothetical protein